MPVPPSSDARLAVLLEQVRDETVALLAILPGLQEAQWAKSRPAAPPRPTDAPTPMDDDYVPDDVGIRSKGQAPADPTGDAVVDPKRLRVRAELRRADRHALHALALVRGTRAACERALSKWEGP